MDHNKINTWPPQTTTKTNTIAQSYLQLTIGAQPIYKYYSTSNKSPYLQSLWIYLYHSPSFLHSWLGPMIPLYLSPYSPSTSPYPLEIRWLPRRILPSAPSPFSWLPLPTLVTPSMLSISSPTVLLALEMPFPSWILLVIHSIYCNFWSLKD